MKYSTHFGTRSTPQSEPIPGSTQVQNSAGGYSFAVDRWMRLTRFLVLGTEGGTYYASERDITRENARSVLECIKADGLRVVREVVEISDAGRAPKNDPALYVLAMASKHGNDATRAEAFAALPKVARISTHLFHFVQYRQAFGGWGRGMCRAVARWYTERSADNLALQLVKYRQRDSWTHRDVLRKAHPGKLTAVEPDRNALLAWAAWNPENTAPRPAPGHALVEAFMRAQETTDKAELVRLITDHRLPREAVPTQWLDDATVWEALLVDMPPTALIRTLGPMGKVGLLTPLSDAASRVVSKLADVDALRKARVHPVAVLAAHHTYGSGKGFRGSNTWPVVPQVVDALDAAFYTTFQNVVPSGKRWMLGLDVSYSMGGGAIAGVGGITPRVGAGAMALITARTEPACTSMAFAHTFREFPIGARSSLAEVVQKMNVMDFGGTDCALPMLYALQHKIPVDMFAVYTDNETWAGSIHPPQALQLYREKMGIPAKLIVVGMIANQFTIADPDDAGMMDVVGFDTSAPNVMADFARGGAQ